MFRRAFLLALVAAGALSAQRRFPLKYLDEVGHLGGPDTRTSVDLGIAKVLAEPDGDLRFEGKDGAGKPWRVWINANGGVGGTDVWTADFDRNGHQDLLISAYFPSNGRCIDGTTIYTLMFDSSGRPVPWVEQSNSFAGYKHPPVAVVDINGDGRAEMVTVSCEYSGPGTGLGEDRRISGVYEAKDARWRPVQNTSDGLYLQAAKRQLGSRSAGLERWLPTEPAHWPDFFAGFESGPVEQMRSLITGEVGCGGVRIFTRDGRVVQPQEDPCEILRQNRIVTAEGAIRLAWPPVVIDSAEGRDVYLSDPTEALRQVLKMGYRYKMLGDPASPDLLWVDARIGAEPGEVYAGLRTGEIERLRLATAQPSTGSAFLETTLSVEGRCFVLGSEEGSRTVAESPDCPATANLRKAGISGGAVIVREGIAWQVVSSTNTLRAYRTDDGEELDPTKFEPPDGNAGNVVAAVEFGGQNPGGGYLVEWRSGTKRWLILHSRLGKPMSGAMELPVDRDLFASDAAGLHFLKWENGEPVEETILHASVEWSRAVN